VPDVWINGRISFPDGWWENYVKVKTDQEGRYRLVGLPKARSYSVAAWGLPKNYLQTSKKVRGTEGLAPIAVDFELIRGVRVHGRIADKDTGKPAPATLWYIPLEKNKYVVDLTKDDPLSVGSLFGGLGHRNEADGSYSLLAPPGPGIVTVRAEAKDDLYTQAVLDPADRAKASTSNTEEGNGVEIRGPRNFSWTFQGYSAYRILDLAPDASSLTCDFTFDRGRTLTVNIVDAEGKPLKGAVVAGINDMGMAMGLVHSSFKAVALNPAHPRMISFAHKERKLLGYIRLGGNEKEPVTVRLQPGGVVTGRVLGEDGKPLPGIVVRVSYRRNAVGYLAERVIGDPPIQTDADGRFRIEGIFPDLEFGLDLRKGNDFFNTDAKYRELMSSGGTKNLGDIIAKRPE
jgi:hypothetical protein